MTRQAAQWSEQDLDRRFGLGAPRDELTALAGTLDRLLDRLAASLRREQRFSAELSHELRTPLARIVAEAELALRHPRTTDAYRDALENVLRSARQTSRAIETLVIAARAETGLHGTADAHQVLAQAAETARTSTRDRGMEVFVEAAPGTVRVGADPDVVERILAPIVENACRYGRHRVRLTLEEGDRVVSIGVEDDGPGIAAEDAEAIFEPGGSRGNSALNGHDGAGLGLPLARRVARAAGGDVQAEPARSGRFRVQLPIA
jgi:signal transduction histidine kinase